MTVRRTPTGSRVAIVAVGAMLVGSIFYMPGLEQQGAPIRRGQCMGGFRYGGSVCLLTSYCETKMLTGIDGDCGLST